MIRAPNFLHNTTVVIRMRESSRLQIRPVHPAKMADAPGVRGPATPLHCDLGQIRRGEDTDYCVIGHSPVSAPERSICPGDGDRKLYDGPVVDHPDPVARRRGDRIFPGELPESRQHGRGAALLENRRAQPLRAQAGAYHGMQMAADGEAVGPRGGLVLQPERPHRQRASVPTSLLKNRQCCSSCSTA